MKITDIISATYAILTKWPRSRLLRAVEILRDGYRELSEKYSELEAENEQLKEYLKNQKIKAANSDANKLLSKQPEWDKKGVGNDGKGRKKGKGRGRKPRKGAENRPKKLEPDRTEKATVDRCSLWGRDLSDDAPLETINGRIIEDIPSMIERPEVIKIEQEKKYCPDCKAVITAKSELALPNADMACMSQESWIRERHNRFYYVRRPSLDL